MADREFERLRRVWQTLGHDDPLWAVLSHPDKRGGRWSAAEFLEAGRAEIDAQMRMLHAHGFPRGHTLALDFGCGAGRLSRALAAHFVRVIGMDVSASMLKTARALNTDVGNIEFRENASVRLQGIADASVDLVYSSITLQHIPTHLAAGYVEEFFRVLAPGGIAVFQFVTGTDESLRGKVFARLSNRWLNPLRRLAWRRWEVFEMHVLRESEIARLMVGHKELRILADVEDHAAGAGWHSRRWYVARDAEHAT